MPNSWKHFCIKKFFVKPNDGLKRSNVVAKVNTKGATYCSLSHLLFNKMAMETYCFLLTFMSQQMLHHIRFMILSSSHFCFSITWRQRKAAIKLGTINRILACLDSSKAPGLDEISSKFFKDGAEILALSM